MRNRIQFADNVIAEAERSRHEALSLVKYDARYSDLTGRPSAWCVVTEKGIWSRKFHTMREQEGLRECLEKGYRVILTVGLVCQPGVPLQQAKYASVVFVGESQNYPKKKLSDISARAKLRAASSLD